MFQDDSLREVYLNGETLYEGAVIKVEKWQVRLPDGRQAAREVVVHHGAAAVVPVDDRGMVTLVRQHRVVNDQLTWEIPAGKLDFAGEDPLKCAIRELEEETGLRARHWQQLTRVLTTPGFCTEKINIYMATGLSQHETHMDEDEFLKLKTLPLDEAVQQVMRGEIEDMKTCLGLLMAHRTLHQQPRMEYFDGLPLNRRTAGNHIAEG